MAAEGWSVDGQRLQIRAGFPAGKLVVGDAEPIKLKAKGEWPVQVGTRTLTFKRTAGLLGPKNELLAGAESIPPTAAHVARSLAPHGSQCAAHPKAPATITCARCGSFACEACTGADGTHCRACLTGLAVEAAKKAAALAYLAPVFLFGILGGVLAALIGGAAGYAVFTIAQKTDRKAIKIAAAIGLYGLALVIYLVVVTLVLAR